jgi:quinol monooxygenase YgiN
MIRATVRMRIPAQKRGEALKILKSVAGKCKLRSGFLDYHIYEDILKGNALVYEEMWSSEKDMEHHLSSREYQHLLLVMEMALQPPEVRFETVSAPTGFEIIEKARSSIC